MLSLPRRAAALAALLALAAPTARAQDAPRTTSLAQVLAHADEHAPLVRVARARLAEADAEEEGASPLLSDPLYIELSGGPRFQDGGDADADALISIVQPIEIASERDARLRMAREVEAHRESSLEVARWQVHRDVHFAFHEAIEMRVRLDAAERWVELARTVLAIATARVAAGDASELEVLVASAEQARAEQARVRAEQAFVAARLVVCEHAGWPAHDPPMPAGELDAPRAIASVEELLARALDVHPSLRERESAAREATARAELADREAWPTLDLGVTFAREGSAGSPANYLGLLTLGIGLPIWQQATRERALARAAVSIAEAEREALRGVIEARVRRARSDAVAAAERVAIYTRDVLPRLGGALEALSGAYASGDLDAGSLAAAQRTLMEAEDDALDAFAEYHRALADLEAEVGAEVVVDDAHEHDAREQDDSDEEDAR